MDRPDLDGVFDLQGFTSQVLPHPDNPDLTEVVWYDGPVVIGSIAFIYLDNEQEIKFTAMNLTAEAQQKGLATAVIAEVAKVFRKAGYKTWSIDELDGSGHSKMWQRLGFDQVSGDRLEGRIGRPGKLEKTAKERLKQREAKS